MKVDKVKAMFLLAGMPADSIFEGENPYWGDRHPEMGPRYAVFTDYGPIYIHWRKRVLEINWADTGLSFPVGDQYGRNFAKIASLTPDDVTQGPTMVHAWSYGDAVRYLDRLGQAIQRDRYVKEFAIRRANGTLTDEEKKDIDWYAKNPS